MTTNAQPNKPYWNVKKSEPPPDTPHVRFTNLTRLAPPKKRLIWQNIQSQKPALADLLKEPDFKALCGFFDAQISVKTDDLHDHQPPPRNKKPP